MFSNGRVRDIFLLAVLIILFSCNGPATDKGQYASLSDTVAYTGMQSCRNCHEDKYQTFIHTGMGMSFDHAVRKKSSALFGEHQLVHDRYRNLSYFPHWSGDSLKIDEFRLNGKDTIYKRTETINWIVGSGQHTNSHLTDFNGYVYQVPATFYTQKKQWDLPPGFENGFNSRFSRAIGLECMTCHNAYPGFVEGSENKYSFIANGIDCERCHGPGGRHVREKLSGQIIDTKNEVDYSIVNPAKLGIDLQLDVCQRCHIQGNAVLKPGKSFFDFRPGMHLSDVMDVYMPVFTGDNNEHIMASHAERMKMSACYKSSLTQAEKYSANHSGLQPYKNAMTCVTCHDPHVSVKFTPEDSFNKKCRSCHEATVENKNPAIAANPCTESMTERKAVNDNCVSCHMPRNGTIDIPHVTNTDHWIRVPSKRANVNTRETFAMLQCVNNQTPSRRSRAEAFLSYFEKFSSNPAFLDSARAYLDAGSKDSISANLEDLVRLAFLQADYPKVIQYAMTAGALQQLNRKSYTNSHAWTCYRIGQSYYLKGSLKDAIRYFQRSVDLAPYVPDFRNVLAGALMDAGNFTAAKENYKILLSENPRYASAYINYGFLELTAFENPDNAMVMYDKALKLDPDNIQALLNKSALLNISGKKKEAKMLAERVLQLDTGNEKAMELIQHFH